MISVLCVIGIFVVIMYQVFTDSYSLESAVICASALALIIMTIGGFF